MQKSKKNRGNRRKTKKHHHNTIRKKKSTKGGSAKINFGYSYLIINYTQLLAMPDPERANINHYIRTKDAECNCRALSINPCPAVTDNTPIINQNQELILILKYNSIVSINSAGAAGAAMLQQLLDNILGHAILDYTFLPSKNIIGIFSICLEQPAKPGYGSVIFNIVLTYLEFTKPKDTHLWLGIDLNNTEFLKVLHVYTSFGFRFPFISNTNPFDPTGQTINPIVGLFKRIGDNVPDESTTTTEYNKVSDMANQYLYKKSNPSHACEISFKFDKSVILKSRLWCYLGINNQQFTISPESSDPSLGIYREYGGSYKIYNSEIISGKVCYKLSFETMTNWEINVAIGEKLEVQVPASSYTYHVHPLGGYRHVNILIGPPSGPDIEYFLFSLASVYDTTVSTQFHTVIAIEGIYILSLHLDAIERIDHLKTVITQLSSTQNSLITTTYEYPLSFRAFDWTNPSSFGSDPSIVETNISNYITWFNGKNREITGYNLIKLEFIPWKRLDKNTIFKINVPSIVDQCFPHSDDYKSLHYFNPAILPTLSK
jgi:hypothetical protein